MRAHEHRWSIAPRVCLLGLIALTSGCVAPRATLVQPTCRRVQRGNDLEALAFSVTVETEGMLGEQLVCEVSLHDGADKPIKSTDGRYQNKAGAVAASKTLMVLKSPHQFEALALSIPAKELQIRRADWPVSANFRVYNVAGECLAQAMCSVPSEPVRQLAATRPAQTSSQRATTTTRPATSTPRTERATTTQPTTRPTRPRPAPAERRPTSGDRPTRADGRANSGGAPSPDVEVVSPMDALAVGSGR